MDMANDETMVNTEPIRKIGRRFANDVTNERKYPDASVTSSWAEEENNSNNSPIDITEEGANLCIADKMLSLICFE